MAPELNLPPMPADLSLGQSVKYFEAALSAPVSREGDVGEAVPAEAAPPVNAPDDQPTQQAPDEGAPEAEAPPAPDGEAPQYFRVKVDGKWEYVTEDELAAGYRRQKHLTKREQDAAEALRQAEIERAQLKADREWLAQEKQRTLEAAKAAQPAEPNWDALYAQDPQNFAVVRAAWQVQQDRIRKATEEAEAAKRIVQQDQERQRQAKLAAEREQLLEEVPDWRDPEKQRRDFQEMYEYARQRGMTEQQMLTVANDRHLLLSFRESMLYNKQQAGNADRQQRAQNKIERVKVASPGSARENAQRGAPVPAAQQLYNKFVESGVKSSPQRNKQDLANLFEQMLSDRVL